MTWLFFQSQKRICWLGMDAQAQYEKKGTESQEESEYLNTLADKNRESPLGPGVWGARRVGCTAVVCLIQAQWVLVAWLCVNFYG